VPIGWRVELNDADDGGRTYGPVRRLMGATPHGPCDAGGEHLGWWKRIGERLRQNWTKVPGGHEAGPP